MPQNWKTYSVEDLISNEIIEKPLDGNHGETHPKGNDFISKGIPFVMASDIERGQIDLKDCKFISKEQADKLRKGFAKPGDVLLTHKASIGRTAIVPSIECEYIMLTPQVTYYRIKDTNRLNNQYLRYYFDSSIFQNEINMRAGSGSTRAYIGITDQQKLSVILPPLPIQHRIASILGALDDKIELNLEMNKTLEEMAMALYNYWFVEGTNNINESRPLEEILDFIVDNRGKTAPIAAEGIPLIATNCVKNERIFPTYEKVRYIGEETYANWFRSHPIPGDIIFVNKGAPGSVNLVPDPIDFCIAQDMIALRVNNRFVSNYYLFSYFRSAAVQNEILNMSVGTTIPHLKKTDLLKFNIPIPKSEYLKKYTEKVAPIFEMLNLNQKENQTLSKTRDTLLPKLISGEIEVKEVVEEVSRVV
jgi:type I restriction enzyme S subunit